MDLIQSIDIFKYLKEFLEPVEYLNLMNSSKGLFGNVKRESIYYVLTIKNNIEPLQLTYLSRLIENVNIPKKQLELYLVNVPGLQLSIVRFCSIYLHSLFVDTKELEFSNDFNFTIFNNIPNVSLIGFHGVTKITSELNNIEVLYLEIRDLESICTMEDVKKIEVAECSELKSFVCQFEEDNEIQEIISNPETLCTYLRFSSRLIRKESDLSKSVMTCLTRVDLSFNFPVSFFQNGSQLQYISEISLKNTSEEDGEGSLSSFPYFYGNKIYLKNFDLSIWQKSKHLPNLKSMFVKNCVNLLEFPVLSNLTSLIIETTTSGITSIPTFNNLVVLLLELPSLQTIQKQPKLKELCLRACPSFIDCSQLQNQFFRHVWLDGCINLEDISAFRDSYDISLWNCPKLKKLPFYDSQIPTGNRSLLLAQNNLSLDFKYLNLSGLQVLQLHRFSSNLDRIPISLVDSLSIYKCSNYHSTANLSLIQSDVVIDSCANLSVLHNLKSIKRIVLLNLNEVKDVCGLGLNDFLYIYKVPFLVAKARSYVADLKKGTTNDSIFTTIKCCSILSPSPEDLKADGSFKFDWKKVDEYDQEVLWDTSNRRK